MFFSFEGWSNSMPEAAVPKVDLPLSHQGQGHVLSQMRHQLHRGKYSFIALVVLLTLFQLLLLLV